MSGHTPGPWIVTPTSVTGQFLVQAGMHDENSSFHNGTAFSQAFNEANGRLIAAAPDMLAALKAQHDALDRLLALIVNLDTTFMPSKSVAWPALVQGNAAIAKAEGKP